ncbi:MAG TPA: ABC transporter substrate-binding protein, partial [Polyangiaceae bacterium]|nr:ABC transporter substrate-binding protein [Polyangiaceae bacterium]
ALVRPGSVTPHPRLVPKAILADWPGMRVQHHDLARALEEMRLAGFAYDPRTGNGGYPKTVRMFALADSLHQSAAEVYQQQLARIGMRVQVDVAGWPAYLAKVSRRRNVTMATTGWQADYPDASSFFEPLLSTASIQEEESQNMAFFSNRELDTLIERARHSEASERERIFRRAEEIVAEEAPWALGYNGRKLELWQPYVHGYSPNPVLSQHVRGVWIDRGGRPTATALRSSRRALLPLAGASPSRPRTTLQIAKRSAP